MHSLEPYPKGEIHLSISFVLSVLSSHRSGRNVSESIPKVPWSRFVSQGLAAISVSLWNPGVFEVQAAFANIAREDYRGGWVETCAAKSQGCSRPGGLYKWPHHNFH